MPQDVATRLNKYLALQLGISRREADDLIRKGAVTVNDKPAALGAQVAARDMIEVNGKRISDAAELVYLALNKPLDYVCSRKKQGDSPTIYELIPKKYHALKPVGRLDRDSSGLLLLTNDGDFAFRMTHPKFSKLKIYKVRLNRDLEPLHQQMIADYGVNLDDGKSQLHLERLEDTDRRNWRVMMSEGRNRQIRRTFASLGYTVDKLHRTDFGAYHIGDLKPGAFAVTDLK